MKRSFLDMKCRDNRGVEFVVEMQVSYAAGFEKRIQYNACKAYVVSILKLSFRALTRNLKAPAAGNRFRLKGRNDTEAPFQDGHYVGQIPTGTDYPKLNQVVAITIVDFNIFPEFTEYLSRHEWQETVTGNCYLDEIRHYFIELPKFKKSEDDLETTIEKWCFFIKNARDLEAIPEKLKQEPFLKAFEIANRSNMTRAEWEEYDSASVHMQDERGIAIAAMDKGLKQGIEQGIGKRPGRWVS